MSIIYKLIQDSYIMLQEIDGLMIFPYSVYKNDVIVYKGIKQRVKNIIIDCTKQIKSIEFVHYYQFKTFYIITDRTIITSFKFKVLERDKIISGKIAILNVTFKYFKKDIENMYELIKSRFEECDDLDCAERTYDELMVFCQTQKMREYCESITLSSYIDWTKEHIRT